VCVYIYRPGGADGRADDAARSGIRAIRPTRNPRVRARARSLSLSLSLSRSLALSLSVRESVLCVCTQHNTTHAFLPLFLSHCCVYVSNWQASRTTVRWSRRSTTRSACSKCSWPKPRPKPEAEPRGARAMAAAAGVSGVRGRRQILFATKPRRVCSAYGVRACGRDFSGRTRGGWMWWCARPMWCARPCTARHLWRPKRGGMAGRGR